MLVVGGADSCCQVGRDILDGRNIRKFGEGADKGEMAGPASLLGRRERLWTIERTNGDADPPADQPAARREGRPARAGGNSRLLIWQSWERQGRTSF